MKKHAIVLLTATIIFSGCVSDKQHVTTMNSDESSTHINQPAAKVEQMTLNGQPMDALSVDGKGFPFSDVQRWYENFKTSPEFPKVETRDYTKTPWGYKGSSSTLRAFYNYLAKQDNHGWHVDPPEIHLPPPSNADKP